jgi:hypothetical protein
LPDLVKQKHDMENLRHDRLQRLKQQLTTEKRAAFGSELDAVRKRLGPSVRLYETLLIRLQKTQGC